MAGTFINRQTITITRDGTMARRFTPMPATVVRSSPALSITMGPDLETQDAARLLRRLADELEASL